MPAPFRFPPPPPQRVLIGVAAEAVYYPGATAETVCIACRCRDGKGDWIVQAREVSNHPDGLPAEVRYSKRDFARKLEALGMKPHWPGEKA